MTTLIFLGAIAALFVLVYSLEGGPGQTSISLRPAGLLTWLVGGNWPAKIGAVLLIIGTGALLHYVMMTFDLPPIAKLFSGVIIATGLAVASSTLRQSPQRRAIHLALGGSAAGVAYLTAYSAYGFFQYIGEVEALATLFIVACCTTVFAVGSRAQSIGLLAMVGVFMAPAFALHSPGPLAVYGYYLVASLLVLMMVWLRGWRPLIHLSFLFTLAGGLFFGWTHKFYAPTYYPQMQPMLLLSVALHLFMPFAEGAESASRAPGNRWLQRFDLGYFLLLPLAALVLTLSIAPDARVQGAMGLLGMAVVWLLGAAGQQLRFHQGAPRYCGVALIFVLSAGLLWLDNLPYFLIGAVVACALLCLGPKLGVPDQLGGPLAAVALASAAGYLLQALSEPVTGMPFGNLAFMRHALLAVALAGAGFRMRSRGAYLASVFLMLSASWFFVASARELIRLNLERLPQLIHVGALLCTLLYAVALRRRAPSLPATLLLAGTVFFTGLISANGFGTTWIVPLALGGQLVFSLLAAWAGRHQVLGETVAGVARSILPVILLPWALVFNDHLHTPHTQTVLTLLVGSALLASVQAQWLLPNGRLWPNTLSPIGFVVFAFWLFYQTLFHIEREAWAVAYELLALVYLIQTVWFVPVSNEQDARHFRFAAVLAALSVTLAMLLRLFGPPGILTVLDLNNILLPAVLSLCVAGIGGVMAWWSTRVQSRALWAAGALGLAASAAKLVFLDFGSLGQLGNILAMMGAGVVFLLVAWLAPIPPRVALAVPQEGATPESQPTVVPARSRAAIRATEPVESQVTQPMGLGRPEAAPTARMAGESSAGRGTSPTHRSARGTLEAADEPRGRGWLWLVGGLALVVFLHHGNQARIAKKSARLAAQQAQASSTAPMSAPTVAAETSLVNSSPEIVKAPVQAPARVVDACTRFAGLMPSDYVVYASGAYGGRPLGYRVEPSKHEMTTFDVYVDEPNRDVVLALGAYEPTVWNIRQTRATRIVGIIASGYHEGVVNGVMADVPVLSAAYDSHAPCGHFYLDAKRPQAADTLVRTLLGRPVDTVFVPSNGRVNIGQGRMPDSAFVALNPMPLDRLRPANATLSGTGGLDVLVNEGKLRRSDATEVDVWLHRHRAWHGTAPSRLTSLIAHNREIRVYTVLKPLDLPSGLSWTYLFIVPSGLPAPSGGSTVTILSNDPPRCLGPLCDRS